MLSCWKIVDSCRYRSGRHGSANATVLELVPVAPLVETLSERFEHLVDNRVRISMALDDGVDVLLDAAAAVKFVDQ